MSEALAISESPKGSHLDEGGNLQDYTYEKLLEYWSMVYTLGLLSGVVGTKEEQEAAKDAIYAALEDVAETAVTYAKAAAIAADDHSLPGLGAFKDRLDIAAWNVYDFFGGDDEKAAKAIKRNENELRESLAVDVHQIAKGVRTGKVSLEWLSEATGLGDYKADTKIENYIIAETQGIVNTRRALVDKALNDLWNGVKDIALERYNQFLSDLEKGGLNYALGTLAIDGAFLALEIAIGVAAGLVTGGAGAVALKVSVTIGKKVGKAAGRAVSLVIKNVNSTSGKLGKLNLPEKSIVKHGSKNGAFSDEMGGMPKSTKQAKKETGGPTVGEAAKKELKDEDFLPPPKDADHWVKGRHPDDPPGVYRAAKGKDNLVENEILIKDTDGSYKSVKWLKEKGQRGRRGNVGEVLADHNLKKKGFKQVYPTHERKIGDSSLGQGIDSIFRDPGPPPRLIVSESKYRSNTPFDIKDFPETEDGRQMSQKWVFNRAKKLSPPLTEDELDQIIDSDFTPMLQRVGPNGKVQNIDLKTGKDFDTGEQVFGQTEILKWRDK